MVQRNRKEKSMHIRHSARNHTCYEWFYCIFSPSSQYLAALEGDHFGLSGSWVLTLYEELFPSTSKSFFASVASIRLRFSPFDNNELSRGSTTPGANRISYASILSSLAWHPALMTQWRSGNSQLKVAIHLSFFDQNRVINAKLHSQ